MQLIIVAFFLFFLNLLALKSSAHVLSLQFLWLFLFIGIIGIFQRWQKHIINQIENITAGKEIKAFPLKLNEARQVDNSIKKLAKIITSHNTDLLVQKAKHAEESLNLIRENFSDPLTGVANRRQLEQQLSKALAKNKLLSIVMLDIDYFKKVNDTYGHQVGDEVLKRFAELIKNTIRPGDLLARYGGEEFAVLLYKAPLNHAATVGERIRKVIESTTMITSAGDVNITASLGIAEYLPGETVESLIKRADIALYNAKNNGRNRVEVCIQKYDCVS